MDTVPEGLSLQLFRERVFHFSQQTTEMAARSRAAIERSRALLIKAQQQLRSSACMDDSPTLVRRERASCRARAGGS